MENGLDPVYVLHWEHPILIEGARSRRSGMPQYRPPHAASTTMWSRKPSGAKIASLAQTLPMMAQRRMVFVRDLGLMPADNAKPLLASFAKAVEAR